MSKHTLAPWHVTFGNSQMCDKGTTVWHRGNFGVYSESSEHGDCEADANLIAAAPELLDELNRLCDVLNRNGWSTDKAQAIIEKANTKNNHTKEHL